MSIGIPPVPPDTAVLPPPGEPLWRITVEMYHEMIDAGILLDGDPVELLDGLLVNKMSKKPRHSVVTTLLRRRLESVLPPDWYVGSQEPITTDTSEPEPDISVVRGEPRQYLEHHPLPADVGMLAEVSDTTLARDRGLKKRVYARAGITVYWIVNLVDNQVEVYTDPTGPAEQPDYRQRQVYLIGDSVPVFIENQEVARLSVAELLQ